MCISISLLGGIFYRYMHELPSVRSQGTLTHLNILHYADFVPCTFSFSSVRVQVQAVPFLVYEKRRWGLYVLLLDFVPLAFVFDCICNIWSFFFDPRTDSWKTDIFFLNLTKIELSSANCSRIKWNSCQWIRLCVCADLISAWVLFWTGSHCT